MIEETAQSCTGCFKEILWKYGGSLLRIQNCGFLYLQSAELRIQKSDTSLLITSFVEARLNFVTRI